MRIGKDSEGNLSVADEDLFSKLVVCIGAEYSYSYHYSLKPYDSIPYYKFQENKLWGLKNRQDEIIIPANYDFINLPDTNNDLILCRIGKKKGAIDVHNKKILPVEFDKISFHENGYIEVMKNNKEGIVNLDGSVLVDTNYDGIINIDINKKNGYIRVINKNKRGLYKDQKEIVEPIFFEIYSTNDTIVNSLDVLPFIFMTEKNKKYYLDKNLNFREMKMIPQKTNIKSFFARETPKYKILDPISISQLTDSIKREN